jgi:uncharacterized protein (TIGR02996 family)
MSDEAFLSGLQTNPADDTARLVYADWLDEHDEPLKAEYLRQVAGLPLRGDEIDISSAEAIRANELGARLPTEWSERAAGRFDLILLTFKDKIRAIKRLREVFELGLRDAVHVVETAPNRLLLRNSFETVLTRRVTLTADASLGVAICPCERPGSLPVPRSRVVADCYALAPRSIPEAPALTALVELVSASLKISREEALERVNTRPVLLSDQLGIVEALKRALEFELHGTTGAPSLTRCSVTQAPWT